MVVEKYKSPAKLDVLVVDDDPIVRRLMMLALITEGHRGTEAENGDAALTALKQRPFDVILLDVMMPGINGYEVCRRVKQDPKTAGIPVIFVTAVAEDEERQEGLQAGGELFVSKPFKMKYLLNVINEVVGTHKTS